jgi:tetratricopeptide (TPR) repeat protein
MPIFRNTLADTYMAIGEYESAITELRAALEADPRYRAARERLVRCCERRRRFAEAIGERRMLGPGAQGEAFGQAFEQEGPAGYRCQRVAELKELIARIEATLAKPPERASDILNPPELRLALACAELRDWKGARRWRDRACAQRPGRRPWFDSRPELARARRAG